MNNSYLTDWISGIDDVLLRLFCLRLSPFFNFVKFNRSNLECYSGFANICCLLFLCYIAVCLKSYYLSRKVLLNSSNL